MKKVKNPHQIVEAFVADYQGVFGENLISVIMYGSAVTHEFKPGVSDINMAIILADTSMAHIGRCTLIQSKWSRCAVATPFFISKEFIVSSKDTYPVEFLDMKSNYRILYGDDLLAGIEINREHLRMQCERELKGVALHLRRAFVESQGRPKVIASVLEISIRRLLPVFKALLVLAGKNIPGTKSDIIASIEDQHNLGISVLSDIFHAGEKKLKYRSSEMYADYVKVVDLLVSKVDLLEV
jgi:hypothetical protein